MYKIRCDHKKHPWCCVMNLHQSSALLGRNVKWNQMKLLKTTTGPGPSFIMIPDSHFGLHSVDRFLLIPHVTPWFFPILGWLLVRKSSPNKEFPPQATKRSVKYHHQPPRFSNFSKSQRGWGWYWKNKIPFLKLTWPLKISQKEMSSSNHWFPEPMLVLDLFF